jgi:hypothetical protein
MTTTPAPRRRSREFTSSFAQGFIELVLDGGSPLLAAPGIPATEYGKFMAIVTAVGKAVEPITGDNTPDPDAVTEALDAIVRLSLDGLEMVLTPTSLEEIRERVSSKERPLDVTTLSKMFQYLAAVYNGQDPDGDTDDLESLDPPTADDNESPGSSAPTGTSSEDATSTTEPTSEPGDSTPAADPTAAESTPSDVSTPDVTPI